MNSKYIILLTAFTFFSNDALSMEPMSESSLASVSGQNGVNLSGELSFNIDGGPLTSTDPENVSAIWGSCAEKQAATAEKCGTRVSLKPNDTGGWLVLDELQGSLSFEGLTLRARDINAATDDFGGDETAADGKTVLEIGLPSEVKFDGFSYSYATSSQARPTDAGYQQQTRFGVELNGSVQVQGNLLVFPTGNP